ncbi:MAG: hypothetical protein JXA61_01845, partial [Bacteroidales bacterium]|nr:hypothetical protein [Bacteroidales bacterium]
MQDTRNRKDLRKQGNKAFRIVPVFVTLIALGCSVEKNTLVSRTYHNVTSRFNVYFNGRESYEDGLTKIERNFNDEYAEILP